MLTFDCYNLVHNPCLEIESQFLFQEIRHANLMSFFQETNLSSFKMAVSITSKICLLKGPVTSIGR